MARILHIDTSAAKSIVVLSEDGEVILSQTHDGARDGAAVINSLISNALKEAAWGMDMLNAVAVCTGPGSYTGLRIALSTAKGLAYALDIPILAQGRLQLGLLSAAASLPGKDLFLAIIPARTGEYFIAAHSKDAVLPPCLMTTAQVSDFLARYAQKKIAVWGDYEDDLAHSLGGRTAAALHPDFAVWADAAHIAFRKKDFANAATLEPAYLKEVFIHLPGIHKQP